MYFAWILATAMDRQVGDRYKRSRLPTSDAAALRSRVRDENPIWTGSLHGSSGSIETYGIVSVAAPAASGSTT